MADKTILKDGSDHFNERTHRSWSPAPLGDIKVQCEYINSQFPFNPKEFLEVEKLRDVTPEGYELYVVSYQGKAQELIDCFGDVSSVMSQLRASGKEGDFYYQRFIIGKSPDNKEIREIMDNLEKTLKDGLTSLDKQRKEIMEEANKEVKRIWQEAQKKSTINVDKFDGEINLILEEAKTQGDSILEEAKHQGDRILEEADQKIKQLFADRQRKDAEIQAKAKQEVKKASGVVNHSNNPDLFHLCYERVAEAHGRIQLDSSGENNLVIKMMNSLIEPSQDFKDVKQKFANLKADLSQLLSGQDDSGLAQNVHTNMKRYRLFPEVIESKRALAERFQKDMKNISMAQCLPLDDMSRINLQKSLVQLLETRVNELDNIVDCLKANDQAHQVNLDQRTFEDGTSFGDLERLSLEGHSYCYWSKWLLDQASKLSIPTQQMGKNTEGIKGTIENFYEDRGICTRFLSFNKTAEEKRDKISDLGKSVQEVENGMAFVVEYLQTNIDVEVQNVLSSWQEGDTNKRKGLANEWYNQLPPEQRSQIGDPFAFLETYLNQIRSLKRQLTYLKASVDKIIKSTNRVITAEKGVTDAINDAARSAAVQELQNALTNKKDVNVKEMKYITRLLFGEVKEGFQALIEYTNALKTPQVDGEVGMES